MRFEIEIKNKAIDFEKLIQRCGYRKIFDRKSGQKSFVHRAGIYSYPRFHLYIEKETSDKIILNLHLDQKRPSYPGCPAHSAEYDTEIVKKEAERIKNFIKNMIKIDGSYGEGG